MTLQFQRNPFRPMTSTVFVPWNQIVVVPAVVMQLTEEGFRARKGGKAAKGTPPVPVVADPQPSTSQLQAAGNAALPTRYSPPCAEHDHRLMRPVVVSTWMPDKVGGVPARSTVFSETQVSHTTACAIGFVKSSLASALTLRSTFSKTQKINNKELSTNATNERLNIRTTFSITNFFFSQPQTLS